jgi:flagellar transcriptional activator FlhC
VPTRADHHLRAVRLAQECAMLGARTRTIHHVTGLPPREIQRLFFNDPQAIPRGRPPDSPDWYHSANLLNRAEASIFAATYCRLRRTGFGAGNSLVSAYRHYQLVCQPPYRISFDRAFDLASHTDGIWIAKSSSFDVISCPACHSRFLAAVGTVASADICPFCKLLERYGTDPRLQSSFPTRPMIDPALLRRVMAVLGRRDGGERESETEAHLPRLPVDPPDG